MRRKIILYPDPVLRQPSLPAGDMPVDEIVAIVGDLAETMYAENGLGLSAPQIGVRRRIFVIDPREKAEPKNLMVFIDPVLTFLPGGRLYNEEGCLSFPGIRRRVPRAAGVQVEAKTIGVDGADGPEAKLRGFNIIVTGEIAVAIQHEHDHLDGMLFVDRISRADRRGVDKKLRKAGHLRG